MSEITTTEAIVSQYNASEKIFEGLIREVRELSKKKPDATMSASKVKLINRVLSDLSEFLKTEPEGKYLDLLDEDALPQMSDGVLVMVQFEAALLAFYRRYHRRYSGSLYWVTNELVAKFDAEDEDEDSDNYK